MSLMWNMKKPLWETGKTVITNSGFCMLRGFIGMFERGLYRSELVKKHRYRPTGIYRYGINAHFYKKMVKMTSSQEIGRAYNFIRLFLKEAN